MTRLYWRPRRQSILEDKPRGEEKRSARDRRLVGQGTIEERGRTTRGEWADKDSTVEGEEKKKTKAEE